MVLNVSQLDFQALSKFNYCHVDFDSHRYCIRSCKLNSNFAAGRWNAHSAPAVFE